MSLKLKENFMSAERMSSRTMRELEILRTLPILYVKQQMCLTNVEYIKTLKHALAIKEEIARTAAEIEHLDLDVKLKKQTPKDIKAESEKLKLDIQELMEEEALNEQICASIVSLDKGYLFMTQDYLDYVYDNSETIIKEVYETPSNFNFENLDDVRIVELIDTFFLSREENIQKLTASKAN